MNINPISFNGVYCLNTDELNVKAIKKINSKREKYSISMEAGTYSSSDKLYMTVPYEMEAKTAKMLKKLSVNYEKIDEVNALSAENIVNRMILPISSDNSENVLQNINVKKLDTELKKDNKSYIGKNGQNAIGNRYDSFKEFLKTNQQIIAPIVKLDKAANGEITTKIIDGRHRFALLRDMGLKNIPVCIDKKSLELAKEIELI